MPSRTLAGFTRFNVLDPSPLARLAVMPILRAHGRVVYTLTALFSRAEANALFAEQMKVVMGEKAAASRTHGNRMVFPSHTFLEDHSDLKRRATAKVSNGSPSNDAPSGMKLKFLIMGALLQIGCAMAIYWGYQRNYACDRGGFCATGNLSAARRRFSLSRFAHGKFKLDITQ